MHNTMKAAVAAVALLAAGAASAQSYPTGPVTMIIPYPPGGATDIIGRIMGQNLNTKLGVPVVIENRAGATGNIGAYAVARAKPDGYTILMGALTSHSISSVLTPDVAKYDLAKDFAPVSIVGVVPLVLVVSEKVPAKSVAELIKLAKDKPNTVTYASSGNGSPQHLAGALFALATKTELVHVPYKGSGPAMIDLISGEVMMMLETAPAATGHIKGGKLRALMAASKERIPTLPDVPTAAEAGFASVDVSSMFGIAAPAGTPQPVIDRLNKDIKEILAMPEAQQKLAEQGVVPGATTPAEAAKRIADEQAKWARVIKDANVKPD